jgi:hypothetical protein
VLITTDDKVIHPNVIHINPLMGLSVADVMNIEGKIRELTDVNL